MHMLLKKNAAKMYQTADVYALNSCKKEDTCKISLSKLKGSDNSFVNIFFSKQACVNKMLKNGENLRIKRF